MRWVVLLEDTGEHMLYLPRLDLDDERISAKLPVRLFFAATFGTRKQAELALMQALSKGYQIKEPGYYPTKIPSYEKIYPRSHPPIPKGQP